MRDGDLRDPETTATATAVSGSGSGSGSGSDSGSAAPRSIGAATAIGRFSVLGVIGSGGMGQVYSAYDPQLDRRVALKLLHTRGDPLERQRLIREAQALARLAHPNVVVVHEVGSHEGHVFVAMEFVDGTTLRAWADANPPRAAEQNPSTDRTVRAIELLRDAGRGVQAAHQAGLVHRDIKPRNILVGADGRVRVVDFGLARAEAESDLVRDDMLSTAASSSAGGLEVSGDLVGSGSSPLLGTVLTQTGKIVGTPAYMAPEQFRAGLVDHAADQFAFCVTAWEVLFGVRPFAGNVFEMLAAIQGGSIARPAGIDLAAPLEAALRKGLAFKATRRHADMATLLDVLEATLAAAKGQVAAPRRGARRLWVASIVVVGAASVVAWRLGDPDRERCAGGVSQFDGVWDPPRKTAVREAVLATAASFAPATWTRLERNVDGWRDAWVAGHRDACEAAQVRGEQSQRLMDLRMACLKSRKQQVVAYLDLLAAPDVGIIASADDGFAALPQIDRCGDPEYVEHRGEGPEDPADVERVDAVLEMVARATALHAAGDYDGALVEAQAAVEAAQGVGVERVQARALLALGSAQSVLAPAEAVEPLERSYLIARRAALAEVSGLASLRLAAVLGRQLYLLRDSRTWMKLARAEAEASGDPVHLARSYISEADLQLAEGDLGSAILSVEHALGTLHDGVNERSGLQLDPLALRAVVLLESGDIGRGAQAAREALATAKAMLGDDHPALDRFYRIVAEALLSQSDVEGAIVSARDGLRVAEAAYGLNHRLLAPNLRSLAIVLRESGEAREALSVLRRARSLDAPRGPDDLTLANLLDTESGILAQLGDLEAAEDAARRAYEHDRAALGERHPRTALRQIQVGALERLRGRRVEGTARMRLGLALAEDLLGMGHRDVAEIYDRFGQAATIDGNLDEAYDWYSRSFTIVERIHGKNGLGTVGARVAMCEITTELGQWDIAIGHCEGAISILDVTSSRDLLTRGYAENNLGAALFRARRVADAEIHYVRALDHWANSLAPESMPYAIGLANLAELHLVGGRPGEALALYERSIGIRERVAGEADRSLVTPLVGASEAARRLGRHAPALRDAQRAFDLAEQVAAGPRAQAQVRETLARALDGARTRRGEARRLAKEALAGFETLAPSAEADVTRVRAWLEHH